MKLNLRLIKIFMVLMAFLTGNFLFAQQKGFAEKEKLLYEKGPSKRPGATIQPKTFTMMPTKSGKSETLYSTDFESFTAGQQLACQDPANWTTLNFAPCGSKDPYISTDYAHSGSNSVNPNYTDPVLLLGDKTSGKYSISFWLYTPANYGGECVFYHEFAPNNLKAASTFYFDDWGGFGVYVNQSVPFIQTTHPVDQWFKVTQVIDIDQDSAWFYLDGTLLLNWQWSLNNSGQGTSNQLAAILFEAEETNSVYDGLFYFDDIEYKQVIEEPSLYSTDFESFTAGQQLACQDPVNWTTLNFAPCGSQDPYISTDYAHGGSNSVKFSNAEVDMESGVLLLGDQTSGRYNLSFWLYTPADYGGFCTYVHDFSQGNMETGAFFYFDEWGGFGVWTGINYVFDSHPFDQWFKISCTIDLDKDSAWFYKDGTLITDWKWSLTSSGQPGTNQIGAIVFQAMVNGNTDSPLYYVDDVEYKIMGQAESLTGTVTKLADGSPVQGETVTINNVSSGTYTAITEADGTYAISGAAAGDYALTIEKAGFNVIEDVVTLVDGQTVTKDYQITAPVIASTPDSIAVTLPVGETVIRTVTLYNNGDGPMNWAGVLSNAPTEKISIPASDRNFEHSPASVGRAPESMRNAPVSAPASSPMKGVRGSTAYAFEYNSGSLISFDVENPQNMTTVLSGLTATGAAFDPVSKDNIYTITEADYPKLYKVNLTTGNLTVIGPLNGPYHGQGLAYDRTTGIMYATGIDEANFSNIYTVDTLTGAATLVGSTNLHGIVGIAIDGTGQMYGYDVYTSNAFRIDKYTGNATLIGSIGFNAGYAQDMAWDPISDNIYLAAVNVTSGSPVYEIRIMDRTTGNTALIGPLRGQTDGLTFPGGAYLANITPVSGTLAAGDSVSITVSFNGNYVPTQDNLTVNGNLVFSSSPNVGTATVALSMTLAGELNGSLNGTVSHSNIPETGVTVKANRQEDPVYTYTTITGVDGTYDFDSVMNGKYTITAEKEGFNSYSYTDILISGGQATVQNIAITAPAMAIDSTSITATAPFGTVVSRNLHITNDGDGPLSWTGALQNNLNKRISVPASDGNFEHTQASLTLAPKNTVTKPGTSGLKNTRGTTAYGYNFLNITFISINTDDPGNATIIDTIDGILPFGGTFDAGNSGFIYIIDNSDGNIKKLDVATCIVTTVGPAGLQSGDTPTGLTCDRSTGILYASSTDGYDSRISTINPVTGASTLIGSTGFAGLIGIAIDGSGQMYGYDIAGDNAYKIDKTTGYSTLLGSIGFDANYIQGMCWDPAADNVYLAAVNMTSGNPAFQLRILDRTTGNTIPVGDLPGEIGAFAIPTGWLNYSPKSGIIEAGNSTEITLTMDGNYLPFQGRNNTLTGSLSFTSDPNVGAIEVPVTFTVETDYGVLTGTVGHNGNSLEGVNITITREEAPFYTYAIVSDTNGAYTFTAVLPGTYNISASKEGYNPYTAMAGAVVTGSQVTTYDIEMLAPVMMVNPSEIADSASFGNIITRTLTISNTGNGTLNWTGIAMSGEGDKVSIPASNGNFTHSTPTLGPAKVVNHKAMTTGPLKNLLAGSTGYAFDINPYKVFFSFNTDNPSNQNIISAVSVMPLGATFDAIHDDFMYIIDYNDANLKKVDLATGNVTIIGAIGFPNDCVPTGLSCDKETGIIYASCANANGTESMIYTIDPVTGAGTLVGTTGIPVLIDIAIDGTGQMYGFDIATDNAYKIDKATGGSSIIGSIGFDADCSQGMAWDPATDIIYISAYNASGESELRILDRTTGNTTPVGSFAGETDGLAFPGTGPVWLSIDPKLGTVAPGTAQEVTVTLDGNYPLLSKESVRTGHVVINPEPTIGSVFVPVTFTIEGEIFGSLSGTVTHGNIPVEGVTLTATREELPTYSYSVITSNDGVYTFPEAVSGTYKVTAEAAGYNGYLADAVAITGGQITTLDIVLTAPLMVIAPETLTVTISPNEEADTTIVITNTGDGVLKWASDISFSKAKHVISVPTSDGNFPRSADPVSIGLAPENANRPPMAFPIAKLSSGSTGYAFRFYNAYNSGLFSFNTLDPANVNTINPGLRVFAYGSTFDASHRDSIYIIDKENYLRKEDINTSGFKDIGMCNPVNTNHTWTGISVDRNTNIMYGVSTDGNESYIYTIDMNTAVATPVGATGIPACIDIAIDGSGQMYGYDIVGDNSYKIDKTTGTSTLLGSIGFDANYSQGMGCDPVNDIVYLAAFAYSGDPYSPYTPELRALDKMTGNTQYLGTFGVDNNEVDGLAFHGNWLTTLKGSGSILPGESQDITLHFNAINQPEGTYTASIVYTSDPEVGTITIPVTFTIVNQVLSVTPANQDVTYAAGTTSFAVANTGAGTMNYTAEVTSGSDWLTITNGVSGTNSGTIEVSFTENATTNPRVATITVTAQGATGSPVQVTVTQGVNSALLPTFTIATLNNVPAGSITVPVYAANVVNMGSFQFTIEYDPALMSFSGASDWYTGIEAVTMGEPIPGHLTFVWAADMNGINIADGTFFNLNFNWLGSTSTSSLTWSDNPTPREFTDYDGNVFVSVYNNGSVTGSPSQPILTVTPTNQDVTSSAGTTTFAVANTGIGTMNYTAAVTTGNDWLTITSGGSGVNTGTINVAYTENTSTSPRTGTITVTAPGATGSPVQVTVTQAAASVPAAIVTITDTTTLVSGLFVVPVHAENITNMGSFQFTIEYDPSIILFDSITNWHAGIDAVTTGNPSAGHITFVWAADLNGINIADGNFFDINFDWIASDVIQTQVNWSDNPTPREFADYNGNIFVPVYNNGTETGPDGIPEIGSSSVKVFPNPATDVVNITVSNNISTVQVINCLGMVVHSENITQEKTITLNTSRYSAGNYLVRFVTNNGQTLIKKMVIIK